MMNKTMSTMRCHIPLTVILLIGCGGGGSPPKENSTTDPVKKSASATRDELLATLLANGDRLASEGEKEKASDAYGIAREYVADKKAIEAKLKSVQVPSPRGMTDEEAQRLIKVIQEMPLNVDNWPTDPADAERVELQMLLDTRLTGDLKRGAMSVEGNDVAVDCFLSKPSMTVIEVLDTYGKPTADTEKDGYRVVTYGRRVRLIADKSANIAAVLFRSKSLPTADISNGAEK